VKYDDWYNNTLYDGFYYYPQKIERDMNSSQLTYAFIEEYDGLFLKPNLLVIRFRSRF
jgi:hypothetical protein